MNKWDWLRYKDMSYQERYQYWMDQFNKTKSEAIRLSHQINSHHENSFVDLCKKLRVQQNEKN